KATIELAMTRSRNGFFASADHAMICTHATTPNGCVRIAMPAQAPAARAHRRRRQSLHRDMQAIAARLAVVHIMSGRATIGANSMMRDIANSPAAQRPTKGES